MLCEVRWKGSLFGRELEWECRESSGEYATGGDGMDGAQWIMLCRGRERVVL